MKSLLIICLIFTVPSFSQQHNTSNVVLSISDCRGGDQYAWVYCDSISFYKLPEDTLAFKILPRKYKKSFIALDNVLPSKYRITYKNYFKQQVAVQLEAEGHESHLNICLDTLLNYSQNTLSQLQPNDTISIGFSSFGCFDLDNERIVIKRKNEGFSATIFYLKGLGVMHNVKKRKTNAKTVLLTEKNIKDFIRFENELNFAEDGGCTSVDEYYITGKDLIVHKVDGNCRWNGFQHLKKSFFGDTN